MYGIESFKEAGSDAKINTRINDEFLCGREEDVAPEMKVFKI